MISVEELISANPFPGLRAFTNNEADRFFGREQQIAELMERLEEVPFIAVAGTSGCGKSSLVCAGLLNALARRTESEGGTTWLPVISLPGNQPIVNLAKQLSTVIGHGDSESLRWGMLYGQLQLGGLALSEVARLARLKPGTRLLVVIDQFEEIFRFKQENADEASAFVKLLINAANDKEAPVSIIITLRSEFLGVCTDFADLPEAINRGQYLVPKLTREQRKVAITGPVELRGYQIAPSLVQRLLNDVSENFDDLPVMQHALSRTWQRWAENCQGSRWIDIEDYEKIGTTKKALSTHADETAKSTGHEALVERVFRALTQQLPDGVRVRRALDFNRLCAVVGGDQALVVQVVERFRRPDTALLRPGPDIPLSTNPVIDISHESLIKLWGRLCEWVQAEAESSAMLKRVVEASQNHENNNGSLWRGRDLERIIEWQTNVRPTAEWVSLYAAGDCSKLLSFVQRFIATSSTEAAKEKKRWKMFKVTLSVLVIFVAAVLIYVAAIKIRMLSKIESGALASAALLQIGTDPAYSARLALAALERDSTNDKAEFALRQSLATLEAAHTEKIIEKISPLREPVVDARYSGDGQRLIAVSGKHVTILDGSTFEKAHEPIISDKEIQKAWLMDKHNVLVTLNIDGHTQLQRLDRADALPLDCPGKENFAWTVSPSPDDRHVAVGCHKGEVLVWDVTAGVTGPQQYTFSQKVKGSVTVTALGFNFDGSYFASGGADGEVNIWKLGHTNGAWIGRGSPGNRDSSPIAHETGAAIRDVGFNRSETSNLLVTAGDDKQAIVWQLNLGRQRLGLDTSKKPQNWPLPHAREVVLARFTTPRPGETPRVFTASGKTVQRWLNMEPDLLQTRMHDDWVRDINASPNGELLVTASADGTARIWSSRSRVPIAVLRGHTAQVNRAMFSPDGKRVVTASDDGNVRVWQFSPPRELVTLDHWALGAQFEPEAQTNNARVAVVGEGGYASVMTGDPADNPLPMPVVGNSNILFPSWSRDKKYLLGYKDAAGLNEPASLILFDVEREQEITPKWLKGMLFAAFSPGTDELVTVSYQGRIAVWDTGMLLDDEPKPKYESEDRPSMGISAMSPDGQWIAVANNDTAELWNKANLKAPPKRLAGHRGSLRSLQFSRDNRWLLTASEDHTARIWSLDNFGQFTNLVGGHATSIYSASFDRTGQRVVTSGADGTIGVWNAESGKLLATLRWHGEGVNSVEFSPDGEWILSASDDGTVKLGQCEACWLAQKELKDRVAGYAKLSKEKSKDLHDEIEGTHRSILPEWLAVRR